MTVKGENHAWGILFGDDQDSVWCTSLLFSLLQLQFSHLATPFYKGGGKLVTVHTGRTGNKFADQLASLTKLPTIFSVNIPGSEIIASGFITFLSSQL
jgi:hypothetical protein